MKIIRPIFLFGCPNSGTTILWRALKNHTDLSGPDTEDQDIEGMPNSMRHHLGNATFRLWAHPKFGLAYYVTEQDYNEEDTQRLRTIYCQSLAPGTRLVVKSPAHTLRARLIQAYFPDAYFVAIVRNGYAVAEGIVRKRKYDPDRPQFKGLTTTIEEAAEQWFRANVVVVSHQQFLRNYLIVKYEDLVQNPGTTLYQILDHCGLARTSIQVPNFKQDKNDEQIARLTKEEIDAITRIAGPMLRHFGYVL
ncbi:MAG: sulfotransferase [Candidatus Doudnabacteria bacterium]|nr:sulfotransferase [Candidatus Doudnabacteria bacterium]